MDILEQLKGKIEEIVNKITTDKTLAAQFKADPITTVEGLLGIDLPNDQLESVVEAIKTKITLEKAGDLMGGLGKLFGK